MSIEKIIQHQETASWCGPACLSEAYNILTGKTISQERTAQLLGATDDDGVDFRQLVNGANKLGLEGGIVQGTPLGILKGYKEKGYVVIINWMSGRNFDEDGHYSLFEDANEKYITLNDPEGLVGSLRIIRKSDFDKVWFDIDEGKRTEKIAIVIKKLDTVSNDSDGKETESIEKIEVEIDDDGPEDEKCHLCGTKLEEGKCPKCYLASD